MEFHSRIARKAGVISFWSLFVVPISLAQANHVHAAILTKDKPVGTVDISATLLSNGRLAETRDETRKSGDTMAVHTLYAKSAKPVEIKVQLTGKQTGHVFITFGKSAVTISALIGKQSETDTKEYPKGADFQATSHFWFVRDRPKVGATCSYSAFDLGKMDWKTLTDTYVGDVTLTYRGKHVTAHKITNQEITQLLDDRGLPYRVDGTDGTDYVRD